MCSDAQLKAIELSHKIVQKKSYYNLKYNKNRAAVVIKTNTSP